MVLYCKLNGCHVTPVCAPYVSVLSLHSPSEINLSNMSDGEDHRMQGGDGVGFMGQMIDEDVEMETSGVERSKTFGSDDRGRDAEAGNEEDEEDEDDDEEGEEESPNERKRKRAKVGLSLLHLSNWNGEFAVIFCSTVISVL